MRSLSYTGPPQYLEDREFFTLKLGGWMSICPSTILCAGSASHTGQLLQGWATPPLFPLASRLLWRLNCVKAQLSCCWVQMWKWPRLGQPGRGKLVT